MRVSQGVPCGRKIDLFNPDLISEREEVIIYTRDEFRRTFTLMREQIDNIFHWGMGLEPDEGWKLMGHWPHIMERVHILGLGLESFYGESPSQTYLDSYMYDEVDVSDRILAGSVIGVSDEPGGVDWL